MYYILMNNAKKQQCKANYQKKFNKKFNEYMKEKIKIIGKHIIYMK